MIGKNGILDLICLRSIWWRVALLVWIVVITDTVFRSAIIRSPTEIVAQYVINIGIGRKSGTDDWLYLIFFSFRLLLFRPVPIFSNP
jgi:hypothetical protein